MNRFPHKQLPDHIDRRIRRGVRIRFWRDVLDQYVLSRMTFALGTAVLAIMFVSSQYQFLDLKRENRLYAQVLEHRALENQRDQSAIVHVKMRVEEGEDKAFVVAKEGKLTPEIAASVPKRAEEVEFWSHSANVMTVVRPYTPDQPVRAFMNLERDDHVHVFRYEPEECLDQGGVLSSPGCRMEQTMTAEQKTYRKVFDSVHNISADYQELISVHTTPFQALDLEPMSFEREEEESIVFVARSHVDLKREYAYDKKSLELLSIRTFLNLDGEWYEMSVVRFEQKDRLDPESFEDVFDPSAYPLKQTESIRLT